ncbi:MAG: NRDE family protein [Gammaproteobacteria bacterium]|nr:NRDE family protein [Gammaproteobacteria bacterium]
MCLILIALQQHKDYPLVVIANRDEFYARPTRSAHWWDDDPSIFAGQDLTAEGTWLGVNRRGRFAAVTNFREPGAMSPGELSRGGLTRGFLQSDLPAEEYLSQLQADFESYSGFNLLLGDDNGLWFASNRGQDISRISPGFYGISNGRFDEAWPKLESGKQALRRAVSTNQDSSQLMHILTDEQQADDALLPETGVAVEFERLLSSRFIRSPNYGTRASTLLRYTRQGNIEFTEKNFDAGGYTGQPVEEKFSFRAT